MSGGIDGIGWTREQELVFLAVERGPEDSRIRGRGLRVVRSQIEEVLAVGKKPWPAVSREFVRQRSEWSRRSARGGNLKKRFRESRREHDGAIRAPAAAAPHGCIANRKSSAARDVRPLQLAIREECDRAAVGRPEGKTRFFGTRDRFRHELVEGAQKELVLSLRPGREPNVLAVGRDHRRSAIVTDEIKL